MTRRLTIFLGLVFSAFIFFNFATTAWGWDCEKGKGEIIERTIDLDKFHSFSISSSADVELSRGKQEVVVVGQSNIIDLLSTVVKNGKWDIDFEKNVCLSKGFTVRISIPELEKVSIDGSGNVVSKSSFSGDEMEVSINGSGDVELELDVKNLDTSINGSGDVEIAGTCSVHEVTIAGSGDVDCQDMMSNSTRVKIMGSGDCKVHASDELNVKVMGSGDVYYRGNPDIETSIMGSGDVKKM